MHIQELTAAPAAATDRVCEPATDPRLVFLLIAACHYQLVEAGDETLDLAFGNVTATFDRMFPPRDPCCPTCGMAPCGNPSFCDGCRRLDQQRSARR